MVEWVRLMLLRLSGRHLQDVLVGAADWYGGSPVCRDQLSAGDDDQERWTRVGRVLRLQAPRCIQEFANTVDSVQTLVHVDTQSEPSPVVDVQPVEFNSTLPNSTENYARRCLTHLQVHIIIIYCHKRTISSVSSAPGGCHLISARVVGTAWTLDRRPTREYWRLFGLQHWEHAAEDCRSS